MRAVNKILVIDLDPQGNATTGFGLSNNEDSKTIYDVLNGNANIQDTIKNTKIENLKLVSSKLELPFNTSYTVLVLSLLDRPNPVVALPCGSKSMTKIFFPWKESAVARLITVVVFPTPPFWLITEIICVFFNLFFY